jgi:Na+/glutamate symporter
MNKKWFQKMGWIYIPTTIIGGIILSFTLLFCFSVFIAIDQKSHSVSDTLYGIFPYFVSAFVILFWIANNKSEKR